MFSFSVFIPYQMLVIMAGNHKMLVRIANSEDTDQAASEEGSSLIWDCTVCLSILGRQLVFSFTVFI